LRNTVFVLALAVSTLFSAGIMANDRANTSIAKRVFLEKMAAGHFDKLDEIYGAGFVAHGSTGDFDLDEDNASGKAWRAAFPDLSVTIERTVAADNLVAVHWRAAGTNTGKDAGMPGKGARVSVQGMSFFRFSRGRIVEEWSLIDIASLMTQLELGGGK
jgi:steroid delta-isomerase-like uncharacterized protein